MRPRLEQALRRLTASLDRCVDVLAELDWTRYEPGTPTLAQQLHAAARGTRR